MMLYTKNAINVFNFALIAPVDGAGMNATGFGDNPFFLQAKKLLKQRDRKVSCWNVFGCPDGDRPAIGGL
nr:hypothetical protein [Pseudomonas sp.]